MGPANGTSETAMADRMGSSGAVAVVRPAMPGAAVATAAAGRATTGDGPGVAGALWARVRATVVDAPGTLGLYVGLALLNLLDLVITQLVLDRGGEEGNPIMAPVVDDLWLAGLMKTLCLAVIWMLLRRSGRSRGMLAIMTIVDVWYVVVVAWNLKVLLHLS